MSPVGRRTVLAGPLAAALLGAAPAPAPRPRYGSIGRIRATAGKRDALVALLLEASGAMPGCLSYVVAEDLTDPDAIWVTEVWDAKASHEASLSIPAVRAAIARARPLIAGFDTMAETRPVGGVGLPRG